MLTCTSHFGVQTRTGCTKKEQIVEVTSKPKFQQMLRACLGNEEVSLKRKITGKGGKTDIIINRKKPFTITYNSGNEVVTVKCNTPISTRPYPIHPISTPYYKLAVFFIFAYLVY